MTIGEFCANLATLELSQCQQALAILWYHDNQQAEVVMSSGQISKIIHESGLGVPHSTQLGKAIGKSGMVLTSAKGFRLKGLSRLTIHGWVQSILIVKNPTTPVAEQLVELLEKVSDPAERSFIEEAITCIQAGAPRAAIVLGWCAVVDRMRRRVEALGFDRFNAASSKLKAETTGKFKHWNKGVQANSAADLLTVFDTDLIIVLEGMRLIDDNQAQRLRTMFQWRCHSAHPADAPIKDAHVLVFFSDAVDLVLAAKNFQV